MLERPTPSLVAAGEACGRLRSSRKNMACGLGALPVQVLGPLRNPTGINPLATGRSSFRRNIDLILGRISGHRDGFGFLVPDDGSDDLFMSPAQMRLVFDGDRALARVSGLDRRGRREGMIVEVVSRAHETIVGRYFEEGGIGFVVADNPKIQQEVLVTPGRNANAQIGQFVEVKITHWPTPVSYTHLTLPTILLV